MCRGRLENLRASMSALGPDGRPPGPQERKRRTEAMQNAQMAVRGAAIERAALEARMARYEETIRMIERNVGEDRVALADVERRAGEWRDRVNNLPARPMIQAGPPRPPPPVHPDDRAPIEERLYRHPPPPPARPLNPLHRVHEDREEIEEALLRIERPEAAREIEAAREMMLRRGDERVQARVRARAPAPPAVVPRKRAQRKK